MYRDKIGLIICRFLPAVFAMLFAISCDRDFNNPVDPDIKLNVINDLAASQNGEWIRLDWSGQEDLRSGYQIERQQETGSFTLIASISNKSITTYLDTTIKSNTEYHYRLRGYSDKNESGYSNIVKINSRFPAPFNLNSTILSDSSIHLSWQDSIDFSKNYLIEKQTESDLTWKYIGETDDKENGFIDLSVEYNINTNYRISAKTQSNISLPSIVIEANIVLSIPEIESLDPLSDHQILIIWVNNTRFGSGYIIERMSDLNPDWTKIGATSAEITNFIDDSLQTNTDYYYRIKARSTKYFSENSMTENAHTTFPAPKNLHISDIMSEDVHITWDEGDYEAGYILKYIMNGEIDTTIAYLEKNESMYSFIGVDTSRAYHIKLYAYSDFNDSDINSAILRFSMRPRFHSSTPAHSDTVTCLDFSGDSHTLASGGADFDVHLWSVDPWTKTNTISGQVVGEPVETVDFTNEAFFSVGYQYSSLKLFENNSWEYISDINPITYELFGSTISQAGGKFAISKYKFVYVWLTDSWTLTKTLPASDRDIFDLEFESQGRWLATASDANNIKIWDTDTWTELTTLDLHEERVLCLAVSADDKYLASAGRDRKIIVWQVSDWTDTRTISNHTEDVQHLQFSQNNRWLASVQKNDNRIFLWDYNTWEPYEILHLSASSTITSMTFSPASDKLVVGDSDGNLWIWDINADWELIF